MTKKIVFGAALALVIVGLAAPSASASCNPPRSSSSFGASNTYFVPSIPIPAGSTVVGRIWSGATELTGTCNVANGAAQGTMFYFYGPGVGFRQDLGDACVPGTNCPGADMSLQVTVTNPAGQSETLLSKATYVPAGATQYDFSTPSGNQAMGSNRPRATSSSRVGPTVNVNLGIDAANAYAYNGAAADITGYNIVSASGAADPGSLASAYTFRTLVPAPGGTAASSPLAVDCSNINQDQWVATQIVTAAGPSNTVSGRTRVNCNPALANPKYNVVPKKGMGSTTQN